MTKPELTFFCELEADALQQLFSDPAVIDELKVLEAGLSLGILDLSQARASVIAKLNAAGIPLTAWLLLPKEQGYWFNLENGQAAFERYRAVKEWAARHQLQFDAIGLDIEPDINEMRLVLDDRLEFARRIIRKLFNATRVTAAKSIYNRLLANIRADGYRTESYQFSVIADQRKVRSSLLTRLFSILDVPVDREVFMLYTSAFGKIGPGFLWSYGQEAGGIGVGSTGGGVAIDGHHELQSMGWSELKRDLLLASRLNKHLYIFSLEGCIQQGIVGKIAGLDWNSPVDLPFDQSEKVDRIRKVGQGIMWIFDRPWIILAGIFLTALLLKKKR